MNKDPRRFSVLRCSGTGCAVRDTCRRYKMATGEIFDTPPGNDEWCMYYWTTDEFWDDKENLRDHYGAPVRMGDKVWPGWWNQPGNDAPVYIVTGMRDDRGSWCLALIDESDGSTDAEPPDKVERVGFFKIRKGPWCSCCGR